jgi:hypothetical protein
VCPLGTISVLADSAPQRSRQAVFVPIDPDTRTQSRAWRRRGLACPCVCLSHPYDAHVCGREGESHREPQHREASAVLATPRALVLVTRHRTWAPQWPGQRWTSLARCSPIHGAYQRPPWRRAAQASAPPWGGSS